MTSTFTEIMNTKYKRTEIEHFQCNAIKKGDKLFLPVTFDSLLDGGQVSVNTPTGYKRFGCFSFIIPEPEPKYDPCRKFRKGDRVKVVKNKGRRGSHIMDVGTHAIVVMDEEELEDVNIKCEGDSRTNYYIDPAYLELVTPAEEFVPYSVVDAHTHWDVADKDMKCVATYSKGHHPNAKAAAEAECKRLNEEYRKERRNEVVFNI